MPNPTETMIFRTGLAMSVALVIIGAKSTWDATQLYSVTIMVGIVLGSIGITLVNLFTGAIQRFQLQKADQDSFSDQEWKEAIALAERLAKRPLLDEERKYLKKQLRLNQHKTKRLD